MRPIVFYPILASVVLAVALLIGREVVEYEAPIVSKSECLERYSLPEDVARARFCDCYTSRLNSTSHRLYRVASRIRHGDLELRGAVQECTAAAFTPKPR